ncbi:type II secretion system protein J [Actinoplanes sp. NPDC051859]|uniref:type II secretion system protein J n=1 Tax=Actinoplanes sp. NPDC051859 TaxID=3363909 RepID=UPI0037A46E04
MTAPDDRGADDGFTLGEVLITMTMLSVVMLMFTGGILQVYRTVQTTDTLTDAQAQLTVAFQRFDRHLRYANWISDPVAKNNVWYVEFADVEGDKCRQLRLELGTAGANDPMGAGNLQLLEWDPASPPTATTRGTTIASQIDTTDMTRSRTTAQTTAPTLPEYWPFELQRAGSKPYPTASPGSDFSPDADRLRIHIKTKFAAGSAEIDVTFTATNTDSETPTANVCSAGRP